MKRNRQRYPWSFIFFASIAVMGFFLFSFLIPKAPDRLNYETPKSAISNQKEVISLVAIGDSLTEGVGDTTSSGGYVPLASKALKEKYKLNAVQTTNYGVAGNRSDQILKRIKNQTEIQSSLENADVITITVGGNDLMKVIRSNLFNNISEETFAKPLKSYQKQMVAIFTEIRKYNKTAPIYVFGIYNPFYLYFSEIEEMQEIVTNWNEGTEDTVNDESNAYFIPINDVLYKGLNGDSALASDMETSQDTTTSSTNATASDLNELIYEGDHFHPNNLGYQIMANELVKKMTATEGVWLETAD